MKAYMKNTVNLFIEQNHQTKLQKYYNQIPRGTCSACPKCCYDNVPLSAVEFASIIHALGERLERYQNSVVDWYLNQYKRVQPCIFLENERCQIYAIRPLTCRLFGHQSKREQLKRVVTVRAEKAKAAQWLNDQYNILVAPQVIRHVIEPCDFSADKPFSKAQANQLFDAITTLSSVYYLEGIIDESLINLTLIEWMLAYFHDEEALFKLVLQKL